jgi:hypothetical protein
MRDQKPLSVTCKIELKGMVKDLQHIKKSTVYPEDGRGASSLLELFVNEVRSLRNEATKPSTIVPLFIEKLHLPEEGPLAKAAHQISLRVEQDPDEPSYHNQHHVVEVVLAAFVLGRREHLPFYRLAELLVAAAAHDLGHNGESNKFDYEREAYSCQIARPILEQCGLSPDSIQRIEEMILGTDCKVGVPKARQAYLAAYSLPDHDENKIIAAQCVLLTEADILFSCFDFNYNDLLSKLLSAELKKPSQNLSLRERMDFLSGVIFISNASRQLGLEERRLNLLREISTALNKEPS